MTKEQMKKLSEDKEFISELLVQETEENVKNLFKSRGVEVSDGDIEDLKNLTVWCMENNTKIPENILENISGGVNIKKWFGQNWDKLIYVACAIGLSVTAISCIPYVKKSLDKINETTDKLNTVAANATNSIDSVNDKLIPVAGQALNNINNITDKLIKSKIINWFLN